MGAVLNILYCISNRKKEFESNVGDIWINQIHREKKITILGGGQNEPIDWDF